MYPNQGVVSIHPCRFTDCMLSNCKQTSSLLNPTASPSAFCMHGPEYSHYQIETSLHHFSAQTSVKATAICCRDLPHGQSAELTLPGYVVHDNGSVIRARRTQLAFQHHHLHQLRIPASLLPRQDGRAVKEETLLLEMPKSKA